MARRRFVSVQSAEPLARQFRNLRREAVLLAPGTALVLGMSALAMLATWQAAELGLLLPASTLWVAAVGLAAASIKLVFDLRDRSRDPVLWRDLLLEIFSPDAIEDPEIRRLALQAIDLRVHVAEAEAKAEDQARTVMASTMPALDRLTGTIARLITRLDAARRESAFQKGLATSARDRLAQLQSQQQVALDGEFRQLIERAMDGLKSQVVAFHRIDLVAESGHLKLEHAVAVLGTICAQVMLVLNREADAESPAAIDHQIDQEVAALDGMFKAFTRVWSSVPSRESPAVSTNLTGRDLQIDGAQP